MVSPRPPTLLGAVTLAVPARDAAATLGRCLAAAAALLDGGGLAEIVVVDDGSRDDTAAIAARHPARVLRTRGLGRGAARNLGWRQARTPLVWFLDADCVPAADALSLLLPHLEEPSVAAVGGSYDNMSPDSLVASLIHEEIVERHRRMRQEVDFLATFNVVYRRSVLEQLGGFDERYLRAQDAELAFRVKAAGGRLRFEPRSRVKHFHVTSLSPYLRAQRDQGYWRVWLYADHPRRAGGDAYSGGSDHVQPPLAVLAAALAPALLLPPPWRWAPLVPLLGLAAAQVPMTVRLLRATRRARFLLFAPFSAVRAFARGFGMTHAAVAVLAGRLRGRRRATKASG